MAHANARLTEFGRLLLVQRITELGWPPARAAESLGVSRAPPTSGWPATASTGRLGWPIAAPGPTAAPMPCPPARCVGCWPPDAVTARAPIASPGGWGWLAPRSMGCWPVTA
jgi:hypothetical protein